MKDDKSKYSLAFGIVMLVIGVLLNTFNIGKKEFFSYSTVGNYLIYISFIALLIFILKRNRPQKMVDERMLHVAAKSNRITFMVIILVAFAVMIIDGVKSITIPYYLFMSYFICGIVFTSLISYKILLKQN